MSKESNANILDPNRFKIAKSMAVIPGGPENNSPLNVTDNASPAIQSTSIYGDYSQNYEAMGTGRVYPVSPSGLQQNFPIGQRNNGMPFGMQQQPDMSGVSPMTDGMESNRLGGEAKNRGLFAGPMGMMGQPAIPGGFPGDAQGTSGPPMMQGMPSAEQAAGKGMNTRTGKRGK